MPLDKNILITVADDKASDEARTERAKRVEEMAKSSPIYLSNPIVKALVDDLIQAGLLLAAKSEECATQEHSAAKARTGRDRARADYDLKHGVLVKQLNLSCTTEDDVVGLGLKTKEKVVNGLQPPVKVEANYDAATGQIVLWVKFAGRSRCKCVVEMSLEPTNEASFSRLEGHGARRTIQPEKPGMWWIRVATQSATGRSAWFGPVSVYVK